MAAEAMLGVFSGGVFWGCFLGVFSGGVFWGCLRMIYHSTFVGVDFGSLFVRTIFDEHLQNQIKYNLNVSASPNISP